MYHKKASEKIYKEMNEIKNAVGDNFTSYILCARDKRIDSYDETGCPYNINTHIEGENFEELLTLVSSIISNLLRKSGDYKMEIENNRVLLKSAAFLLNWLEYWEEPHKENKS